MATEFNYKRAWTEYVNPEFNKLRPEVKKAFDLVCKHSDKLKQRSDLTVRFPDDLPELREAFDAEFNEDGVAAILKEGTAYYVNRVGDVIHAYGHLSPSSKDNPVYQFGGATWKFELLVNTWLTDRKIAPSHEAKVDWEAKMKEFHDHKEGTDYDNDEAAKMFESIPQGSTIAGVRNVNFRVEKSDGTVDGSVPPHPFVIGTQHFPKDGGMYIDMHQAPCAMKECGYPVEAHKSDVVMFLRVDYRTVLAKDTKKYEKIPADKFKVDADLKALKDAVEAHNAKNKDKVRVDGFAFVEGKEV